MQPKVFSADDLREIAERESRPLDEVERDCLLVTIAGVLSNGFPAQLCFKGGFILRHVLGQRRLSIDIDATRHNPPEHKLSSEEVAKVVAGAARVLAFKVTVKAPSTDSGRGLDFDSIRYVGPCGTSGAVAVEVSYREAVQLAPLSRTIGPPFYEPFPIPTMQDSEMVAEKVRTLIQRRRPSDLGDLAYLYTSTLAEVDDEVVRRVLPEKLKLVRSGNWMDRIVDNVESMRKDYEANMRTITIDPLDYEDAVRIVLPRIRRYA